MPPSLARFFEWYLGLPPAGGGEGTDWRMLVGPDAGAAYSVLALRVLAGLLIATVGIVYWLETRRLPWRRGLALAGLRAATAALLVLMLGRWSLQIDRTELPTVAVLIDSSASMGLTDRYADPTLARAVRGLSRTDPRTQPTRLELVQAILTRNEARWLRTLLRTHQVRLYTFDQHLRLLDGSSAAVEHDPAASLVAAVEGVMPAGTPTAPAAALRELLEDFRGHQPAAVILLTDGIASAGPMDALSRGATSAREQGVPLFPVGVGSRDPLRDLELFDLLSPDVVSLGEPATLTLRQRSFGLTGQTTELTVTVTGDFAPLLVRPITAGPDRMTETIELPVSLPEEGDYELTISAAPLAGESDVENNVLTHRLQVRRDPLRVLYVEGQPRWEYRFLKPVLERDDTLQLETWLQSADLDYAPEDRTALRSFPATREQLEAYDVIIWGDVDHHAIGRDVATRLRDFVGDHGGGLILIAGPAHNPLAYGGSDLEVLIPVSLTDAGISPQELDQLRLSRTTDGQSLRFLRLDDDPQEDAAAWEALPDLAGWHVVAPQLKPGALTLASASGPVATPLIVSQRFGRGAVLYHGTDSLWRWRRRVEDRYYGRYWSQAVRAVAPRRTRDTQGRELSTDRRIYATGEEIRLRLRGAGPPDEPPAERLTVRIEPSGGLGEFFSVELAAIAAAGTPAWEGSISDLPAGDYRATLVTPDASSGVFCQFQVEIPDRELRDRAIAQADLEQAARLTHGAYHSFAEADRVPAAIPRGRTVRLTQSEPHPLWNRWETLCLCLLLLSSEWLLRKRARLV
jgi:hypothetical protein